MDELLRKDLKSPPFIRLPVQDYISCSRLMKESNEAVLILKTFISDNASLWTEIGILKIAVYKMKAKWRLEPLFRGTQQVLKCMKILQSQRILETITTTLDSVLGLDGKTLVPSQQYLQYLLVKIIGVGKLMMQTIEYCMYVQSKLMNKMQVGHMMVAIMSFTAIISRIWMLSHTLLVQMRGCYDSIYALHLLASAADYTWLLDNVTLPDRFPLDVDSLIQRNSGCNDKVIMEHSSPATPLSSTPHEKSFTAGTSLNNSDDVGIVISRASFASSLSQIQQSSLVKQQPGIGIHRERHRIRKHSKKCREEVLRGETNGVGNFDKSSNVKKILPGNTMELPSQPPVPSRKRKRKLELAQTETTDDSETILRKKSSKKSKPAKGGSGVVSSTKPLAKLSAKHEDLLRVSTALKDAEVLPSANTTTMKRKKNKLKPSAVSKTEKTARSLKTDNENKPTVNQKDKKVVKKLKVGKREELKEVFGRGKVGPKPSKKKQKLSHR